MGLFDIIDSGPQEQESAEQLIGTFRRHAPCNLCALSEINQNNPGFIYRGNVEARIAVLSDTPFSEDMSGKSVFCGPGRYSWIRIMKQLGIREDQTFLTFVSHCRSDTEVTLKKKKKGKRSVEAIVPKKAANQDVLTCFNMHTIPVLRSMPNLEVLICAGKVPTQMILKEDFQAKRHTGNFFFSSFLPNVPVFILENPRDYDTSSDFKLAQLSEHLKFFQRKYIESGQISKIHTFYRERVEREEEISLNAEL